LVYSGSTKYLLRWGFWSNVALMYCFLDESLFHTHKHSLSLYLCLSLYLLLPSPPPTFYLSTPLQTHTHCCLYIHIGVWCDGWLNRFYVSDRTSVKPFCVLYTFFSKSYLFHYLYLFYRHLYFIDSIYEAIVRKKFVLNRQNTVRNSLQVY